MAWRTAVRDHISAIAPDRDRATAWIKQVEGPTTTRASFEHTERRWQNVDAQIKSAAQRIVTGSKGASIQRKIIMETEKAARKERAMTGRQVWWLVCKHYDVSKVEGYMY